MRLRRRPRSPSARWRVLMLRRAARAHARAGHGARDEQACNHQARGLFAGEGSPAGPRSPRPNPSRWRRPAAPAAAVELIGHILLPPDALRPGAPSGQFDGEGRRAAAPRFDAAARAGRQLHQARPHAGRLVEPFGQWLRPQVEQPRLPALCIYLFDVRPHTQAGADSRTALQAVIELSDPARFFPWRLDRRGLAASASSRARTRTPNRWSPWPTTPSG